MAQDFGEIVNNEPIARCEHLTPDDVDLPSGQIGMQSINKGAVVELRRQSFEQVRIFQHPRHVMVRVADEGEAGLGAHRIYTTRELLVCHVVLHDIDKRLVGRLLAAGKFVKGHDIPKADQSDPAIGIVHEKLGNRDFTARDQLTMW